MPTFTISFTVDNHEWESLRSICGDDPRQCVYADDDSARFELLYCAIQMSYGGVRLFPPERLHANLSYHAERDRSRGRPVVPVPDVESIAGVTFSLIDVIYQMSEMVGDQSFESDLTRTHFLFEEVDDNKKVRFTRRDGLIVVGSNVFGDIELGLTLSIPESRCFEGVREFLASSSIYCDRMYSGILSWRVFDRLRSLGIVAP